MVDIDKVYQKVLAIANKEQRGYITPQEFNLFADQAQMEVFEQYFYDLDQFKRAPASDGYGSPADFIEQKIAPFIKYDKVVSSFNQWGDVNIATIFPDFYKLIMVRVDYRKRRSLTQGFVTATKIELNELTQYASPLTSTGGRHERSGNWRFLFPTYTNYGTGNDASRLNKIKVYVKVMGNKYNAKPLTKGRLEWAYAQVKSASQAARLLNIDFKTFKKYAQQFDMYEQFCNKAGKGIAKHYNLHSGRYNLDDILEGKYPSYDTYKLQQRIVRSAYLPEECDICNFSEQRITDKKVPLKIDFVDGNTTNHLKENIRLLCYNCWFLNVGNLSGRKAQSVILNKQDEVGGIYDDKSNISIEDIQKEIDEDKKED